LFTSAIKPILMVDAVIPTSEAGTVPVGAAATLVEPVEGAPAADVEAAADAEEAGAVALLVLDELHPAASRTAATAAPATATKHVRLGIRGPEPRPGDSLLGLIAVPSTTSLPVRFGPATPLRRWPRGTIYRAVSKKTEADLFRRWVCRGFVYASAGCK
jgi:hypothetical protein